MRLTAVITLESNKQVHGADLGQGVLVSQKPQDLTVAKLGSLNLWDNARGVAVLVSVNVLPKYVLGSKLVATGATWGCTHEARCGKKRHWLETGWVNQYLCGTLRNAHA